MLSANASDDAEAHQLPLFVYGSLRNGGENYGILRGRTVYEMPATLEAMTLYSLGMFPMIMEGHSIVHGDLMTLHPRTYSSVLDELDVLEGYRPGDASSPYFRVEHCVRTSSGAEKRAWVYLGNQAFLASQPHSIIPHGDWFKYRRDLIRTSGRFEGWFRQGKG